MTEIQALLYQLGWSRRVAARHAGCSENRMRSWADGVNSRGNPMSAPGSVVHWLRACVQAVERVPKPSLTTSGRGRP